MDVYLFESVFGFELPKFTFIKYYITIWQNLLYILKQKENKRKKAFSKINESKDQKKERERENTNNKYTRT